MKNLVERCPFLREGTSSHALYMVLARAKKPMSFADVAKQAKISVKKASTLLAAYKNPFHNAPLKKVGVRMYSKDGLYWIESCAADPKAKRPERGKNKKSSKKAKSAPKRSGTKPKKAKRESKKADANPKPPAAVAPIEPATPEFEPEVF